VLTAKYRNGPGDIVSFNVWAWFHTWQFSLMWVIGFAPVVLITWDSLARSSAVPLPFRIVAAVIMGLGFLLFLAAFLLGLTAVFAYFGRDAGVYTDHTITVDGDGLTEVTPVNSSSFTWEGVQRIARTSKHIFVLVGPLKAHVIPRRCFEGSEEWDEFYAGLTALWQAARA
jgi:hypothetical protein